MIGELRAAYSTYSRSIPTSVASSGSLYVRLRYLEVPTVDPVDTWSSSTLGDR